MTAVATTTPTFVIQIGSNGQITVSQLSGGNLSSATLNQLYSGQRDIPGPLKLLEALIIRNLT